MQLVSVTAFYREIDCREKITQNTVVHLEGKMGRRVMRFDGRAIEMFLKFMHTYSAN